MKNHIVTAALLLFATAGAACQSAQRPVLLWVGGDIAVSNASMGAGANMTLAFETTPRSYLGFSGTLMVLQIPYFQFGGSYRYYPVSDGFVIGADLGATVTILQYGSQLWGLGAGALIGYDFGSVCVGLKSIYNTTGAPSFLIGAFLDLTGEAAAFALRLFAIFAQAYANASDAAVQSEPTPIQTRIVSDFTGLNSGNIFQLSNGQIWQQTEYYYYYHYAYRPTALIFRDNGAWFLSVQGIDHAVRVKRVQ